MADRKQEFLSATQKLSGVLTPIVEISVREYHELGGVHFSRNSGLTVEKGVRRMMKPVWEAYQEWLVSLGVKTRSEVERLWRSFGEEEGDVQRSVQELLRVEEEYDALLKKVEADVQKQEDTILPVESALTLGSSLPTDLSFTDLDSGKSVSLDSFWKRSAYTLFILVRHYT